MTDGPDIHSFTQLFNRHSGRFIAFAMTYVGERSAAEDIVMDSFLYYWEKLPSLASNANPAAYLLTVVKHKCLNHLRSKAIHARIEEDIADHSHRVLQLRISTLEVLDPDEIFSEEVQRTVRKAIESLPEKTRRIFLMSRMDDKTYKEIADELSLSVKSVEFELSKATKMLRAMLRDSSLYVSLLAVVDLGLIKL